MIIVGALIISAIVWLEGKKVHGVGSSVTTTPLALTATASTSPTLSATDIAAIRAEKAKKYPPAVELVNPSGFVNTPDGAPISIGQYIGKDVVMIDFMTYSCINCQRTFPYLTAWYGKYKDQGLVIIGIHTPEFEFEKVYANVQKEMARYGITFPVVLDNDYGTWNAYQNQYWPRKYMIDIDGYVVYDHIGEGEYVETEQEIKNLLQERDTRLGIPVPADLIDSVSVSPSGTAGSIQTNSPETYFGANRNQYIGNGAQGKTGIQNFILPNSFASNMFYFSGSWNVLGEYAQGQSAGSGFVYPYTAKDVYVVASASTQVVAEVTLDGLPVPANLRGTDVYVNGGKTFVKIQDSRLYNLVTGTNMEAHTLRVMSQSAGLEVFTLTFG